MRIACRIRNYLLSILVSINLITLIHTISSADLNYYSIVSDLCKKNNLIYFQQSLMQTTNNNTIQVIGITGIYLYNSAKNINNNLRQYKAYFGSSAVLVTGAMHPRQHTSYVFIKAVIQHIIQEYSKGNKQIKYILDNMVLLVIPFVNIDAIKYGFNAQQNDKFRKNMNIRVSQKCTKVYDKGVDINRNFDYKFATVQTSSNPCSQQYHGIAPFSQPQSRSILTLFQHFKITTAIDVHSYGNLWIYPYASDTNPKKIQSHQLYPQYQYLFNKFKGLGIQNYNCYQSLKYVADGVYIDWALQQGAISFALEFGNDFTIVGNQITKHIEGFLEVLKINGIIFQQYLVIQPSLTLNQNDRKVNLCVKSLSMLQIQLFLIINQQKIQQKKIATGLRSCFLYDFNKMMIKIQENKQLKQSEQQIFDKIALKFANTQDLYSIDLNSTPIKNITEPPTPWLIFLKQLKMFLIVVGILCLISSLCGLSIFCQKSLNVKLHEQQKSEIATDIEFRQQTSRGLRIEQKTRQIDQQQYHQHQKYNQISQNSPK